MKPSTITFPVFPLNAEETLHLLDSRDIGYNDFSGISSLTLASALKL